MDKEKGFYQKYVVQKISNPTKKIDAIVLEFDDPIARVGIAHWAEAMLAKGYKQCFRDVLGKICFYAEHGEQPTGVSVFSENLELKTKITELEQKLKKAMECVDYYCDGKKSRLASIEYPFYNDYEYIRPEVGSDYFFYGKRARQCRKEIEQM